MPRPVRCGEPVVGDQDQIHSGVQTGWQVEVAGGVEDLGFHPGQHPQPGLPAVRRHGRGELRHPAGVLAYVVDQAQRPQAALPGGGDVFGQRAGPVGERGVDVEILVQLDPGGQDVTCSSPDTSAGSTKHSSRNRTTASSRKSRWAGSRWPSRACSASRGMSTPAAMVSPSVPGIRGLSSSSAGQPSRSRLHCTLATNVTPVARATARPKYSTSGSCTVRPPTETPESTRARIRGTLAITCPLVSASTSTEYSSPGRKSCTISASERSTASSSAAEPTMWMPRDPLPVRGLTTTGEVQDPGATAASNSSVRGIRTSPAHGG